MGRIVFATGVAAFGVQHLVHAVTGKGVGPPWIPGPTLVTVLAGVALLVAAGALAIERRSGAIFGILVFVYSVALYAPALAVHPADGGKWAVAFELVAIAGVAWVLAGRRFATVGRLAFALSLVVFGILHFRYGSYIATLVPAWIPFHLFWAYFVGVAFIAAAISIGSGIFARLGAALLAAMFFLWTVLRHIPRVVAAPSDPNEWTSALVALALAGGAWIVARESSWRGVPWPALGAPQMTVPSGITPPFGTTTRPSRMK